MNDQYPTLTQSDLCSILDELCFIRRLQSDDSIHAMALDALIKKVQRAKNSNWDENQRRSRILNAQHKYEPRRNEDNFCAGCGQDNALHPDTMRPSEECQMSRGESGIGPEDYRLEQRKQLWEEYEERHCDDDRRQCIDF